MDYFVRRSARDAASARLGRFVVVLCCRLGGAAGSSRSSACGGATALLLLPPRRFFVISLSCGYVICAHAHATLFAAR